MTPEILPLIVTDPILYSNSELSEYPTDYLCIETQYRRDFYYRKGVEVIKIHCCQPLNVYVMLKGAQFMEDWLPLPSRNYIYLLNVQLNVEIIRSGKLFVDCEQVLHFINNTSPLSKFPQIYDMKSEFMTMLEQWVNIGLEVTVDINLPAIYLRRLNVFCIRTHNN